MAAKRDTTQKFGTRENIMKLMPGNALISAFILVLPVFELSANACQAGGEMRERLNRPAVKALQITVATLRTASAETLHYVRQAPLTGYDNAARTIQRTRQRIREIWDLAVRLTRQRAEEFPLSHR